MQRSLRRKLVAGLVATGVLAGGGTAAAVLTGGAAATAAATTTAASAPSFVPVPLQQLVANGTITQAQASAIHDALFAYVQANGPGSWASTGTSPMLAPNGPLQTVLGQLVENGTITQAQAGAVTNAMSSQANAHFGTGSGTWGGHGPGMMGGFGPPWVHSSSS